MLLIDHGSVGEVRAVASRADENVANIQIVESSGGQGANPWRRLQHETKIGAVATVDTNIELTSRFVREITPVVLRPTGAVNLTLCIYHLRAADGAGGSLAPGAVTDRYAHGCSHCDKTNGHVDASARAFFG